MLHLRANSSSFQCEHGTKVQIKIEHLGKTNKKMLYNYE